MKLEPTEAQKRRLLRLKYLQANLGPYGETQLKIRTKEGKLAPFILNKPQQYVHECLEKQLAEIGRVRALVLKGRQQGISTYVGARYYHKAAMRKGRNVYIMSHEQKATDNLFAMVDRYHSNNSLAPHTGTSNAKELVFDRLDSSYVVATAGQKAGGRGRTPHLFHGSEVAFWANAADHFAASVQGVPDMPGTEIILESTAQGTGGEFYERWQDAVAGRSDYQAIFIPWYWSDEYRRDDLVDEAFELSTAPDEEGELSEAEYAELFELDYGQMAWRRNKIAELRSFKLFKQEYPATADEAFQAADVDSYIKAANVLRARKRKGIDAAGPLIFGVDPAGPGGDRFAVTMRRGYKVEKIIWRDKLETAEAHQWLKKLIDEHDPARVFIDAGGIGYATISLLRNDAPRYAKRIVSVNFGATSEFKQASKHLPGPKNRRAEMRQRMKDWLELEEGVSIPDMDVLQGDLTAPQLKPTTTNDILLESKDDMKKRGIRSPDLADSLALTFASLRHIKDWTDKPRSVPAGEPDSQTSRAVARRGAYRGRNGWMA